MQRILFLFVMVFAVQQILSQEPLLHKKRKPIPIPMVNCLFKKTCRYIYGYQPIREKTLKNTGFGVRKPQSIQIRCISMLKGIIHYDHLQQ